MNAHSESCREGKITQFIQIIPIPIMAVAQARQSKETGSRAAIYVLAPKITEEIEGVVRGTEQRHFIGVISGRIDDGAELFSAKDGIL